MTPNEEKLALLEQGHAEAEAALAALKADWAREDAETAERRAVLLEAHAQGDRDRDAVRVELGGTSLIEVREQEATEAEKAEIERKARAERDASEKAAQEALAAAEAKVRADAKKAEDERREAEVSGEAQIEAQKRENAEVEEKNHEVEVARRVEADTILIADERAKPSGPQDKP